MDIPRGPDALMTRMNPAVLELQRDEVVAMMRAMTHMANIEHPEQLADNKELQPLLGTIPRETMEILSVPLAQFMAEATIQLATDDGVPAAATMMQMIQNGADVGHRCGYLKGLADREGLASSNPPEETQDDGQEDPDDSDDSPDPSSYFDSIGPPRNYA